MSFEEIIRQWREEAGINRVGYSVPGHSRCILAHYDATDIYIITSYPGLMIGYHGELINKYREILRDEGFLQEINILEIYGDVKVF